MGAQTPSGVLWMPENEPLMDDLGMCCAETARQHMCPSLNVSRAIPKRPVGVAGKTLEVRRSEAAGDKGRASTGQDLQRLFLLAQQDRHRPRIGLPPLPAPVPPPPAPSECVMSQARTQQRCKPCPRAATWRLPGSQSSSSDNPLGSSQIYFPSRQLAKALLVAQGQEEGDPVG